MLLRQLLHRRYMRVQLDLARAVEEHVLIAPEVIEHVLRTAQRAELLRPG